MIILKSIGKLFLVPVWVVLTIVGITVKLIVHIVSIAKSFIILGLVGLVIGTIICYRDWVQVLFLMCLITSAFLVIYVSVFVEVIIDLAREKIEDLFLA